MEKCQSEKDFDALFNSTETAAGARSRAAAALEEMLIPPSTPAIERKPEVASFADVWTADIGFGFGERVSGLFSELSSAIFLIIYKLISA